MTLNIDQELAKMMRMSTSQLRCRYAEIFGETVRTGNKCWLIKRIAWRLQALEEGDLSERARRRAAELANDADLRLSSPRTRKSPPTQPTPNDRAVAASVLAPAPQDARLPPPGSLLTRRYKGQTHEAKIVEHGFEYQGHVFPTLSALAKKITGTHCNGFWFFRLGRYAKGAKA